MILFVILSAAKDLMPVASRDEVLRFAQDDRVEGDVPDQALVNSDLQSALDEVRQAYIARNPKSFARHQEACEAMPGGNTRTTLHNAINDYAGARREMRRVTVGAETPVTVRGGVEDAGSPRT